MNVNNRSDLVKFNESPAVGSNNGTEKEVKSKPSDQKVSDVAEEVVASQSEASKGGEASIAKRGRPKRKGVIDKGMRKLAISQGIATKGAKDINEDYRKILKDPNCLEKNIGDKCKWTSESFPVESGGRKLEAMRFKSTNKAKINETSKTVILSTGSHQSFEFYAIPMVQSLTEMGHDVVVYNPSGFGLSEGKPSEDHLLEDGLAVFDHEKEEVGGDTSKLKFMGYSLGGAVAAHVGSEREVDVILDRAFSSGADAADSHLKNLGIPKRLRKVASNVMKKHAPLDVENKLGSLKGRVMIVRGKHDKALGPLGKRLEDKAKTVFTDSPKRYVSIEVPTDHLHDDMSYTIRAESEGGEDYAGKVFSDSQVRKGMLWYSETLHHTHQGQRKQLDDFLREPVGEDPLREEAA